MSTLPKRNQGGGLTKKLQLMLTEDAFLRIKVEAAKKQVPPGRLISDWAVENLPPVEAAA